MTTVANWQHCIMRVLLPSDVGFNLDVK
jgi:hypothetical protein